MKFWQRDALIQCPKPVLDFAAQEHLALRLATPYPIEFLTGHERTLWADDGDGVVALWLWTVHDCGAKWWVDFIAVAPRARGKGLYRTMRAKMTTMARRDPMCLAVESHVGAGNDRMRELNEKAGSKLVSVKYRYPVKEV